MHNTLTYISYDQQTIDVRSSDFGAEIIDHNYANGYGTILFDRTITKIGDNAFSDCSSLTSITIPYGVNYIGDKAFKNCERLTSITIPDGVTSIGDHAFHNCGSLKSIKIPGSVTLIGYGALAECDNISKVYCSSTTPPLGGVDILGDNTQLCIIYVPRKSVAAYKNASGWRDYADVILGYDF